MKTQDLKLNSREFSLSLLIEKRLFSKVPGNYSLIEQVPNERWLFSYVNISGEIKHHPIRSFLIGKSKVYKNGTMLITSSLELLIEALTDGLVQLSSQNRCVA